MLPVLRTDQAESDLADILDYVEERSPAAAERLAVAIEDCCTRLAEFPRLGRPREELAAELRSIVIDRYVLFTG